MKKGPILTFIALVGLIWVQYNIPIWFPWEVYQSNPRLHEAINGIAMFSIPATILCFGLLMHDLYGWTKGMIHSPKETKK